MSNIQLNVLFKKMQKDDKKEVLMFHILSDQSKHAAELLGLTGKMTVLTITDDENEYEPINAEFLNIQRDSKKVVLKFNVMTEDKERVNAIYPAAGTNVNLLIEPQQMSIGDFEKGENEKLEDPDEVEGETIHPDQMSLEDVAQ